MKKKIIIASVVFALAVLFGFFSYFRTDGTENFIKMYAAYDVVSQRYEVVAHTPGGKDSTVRKNLNAILGRVLTENMTPANRANLSQSGIIAAGELLKEVDAIAEGESSMIASTANLGTAASDIPGIKKKREAEKIIALAENRMNAIFSIEKTLRETNKSIVAIFDGILEDEGSLTSARILALNEDIPAAEERFEALTGMYRDLDTIEIEIDALAKTLSDKT